MHEQVGALTVNEDGLAVRGMLVRHLVMPGMPEDTREIMRWLGALSRNTHVNVMDQYYPAGKAKTTYQELNRRLLSAEMAAAGASARARPLAPRHEVAPAPRRPPGLTRDPLRPGRPVDQGRFRPRLRRPGVRGVTP